MDMKLPCPRLPRDCHTFFFPVALALLLLAAAPAAEPDREQMDFFEKKIRPVLVEHCYKCHSAEAKKPKGGLLLDTRDAARKGGDTGPAVVPGAPDKSLLLKGLKYDELEMPPAGKLPEAVIADFEAWIKHGAADPRDPKLVQAPPSKIDVAAGKRFWSFQPPRRHTPPQVNHSRWPLKTIDRFLLARLEQAGLEPSSATDRRTLIRRVTFDLTGLPPTPEEVDAFVSDTSGDAYDKVVERLLASPHYGERWAALWLDVARFAEDQAHIVGSDASLTYPNAYLYRDWVVKAFNDDLPYDRFLKEQLAADMIRPEDTQGHAALGFLGLGPKYYNRNNPAVMADEWEDRVDVVGRGLLGLTVACARCHDHKFDPIPTADYYALAGVFAGTDMFNCPLAGTRPTSWWVFGKKPGKGEDKAPRSTMHIVREGKATDLNIFVRGDVNNKGPVAERHFLRVLCPSDPTPLMHGSGRIDLAEAVASKDNPLTARVIVNRIWAQYFGRGIVGTPSNFGQLGERPTHPDLLDDLAVRFVENGWSLKWLHREIVQSAAYRQASTADARTLAADPENRLLGRMSRRRLPVESWRDAILSATGHLDETVGGRSIDPQDPKASRRTVYSAVSRLSLNRLLAMFDHPDPNITADHRVETTTPLQKLFIMNSPFMVQQAEALSERLMSDVPSADEKQRIDRAYRLLFARPPADAEARLGLEYLSGPGDHQARWRQYAHVLLASNEMLFLD
jgi:Protein of unknown function (DUF1553)/Protein of unknown function (DUF1549)/Planctomycete cytochrome C